MGGPTLRPAAATAVSVAIAAAVWLAWRPGTVAAAIPCWLAGWATTVAVGRFVPVGRWTRAAATLSAVFLAGGVVLVEREAWQRHEHWGELDRVLADRARVLDDPVIAPPVVFGDHEQTFWIYAEGVDEAFADLGEGMAAAESLGRGLFRLRHRPSKTVARFGAFDAVLEIDGRRHERSMTAVGAFEAPGELCSSAGARGALAGDAEAARDGDTRDGHWSDNDARDDGHSDDDARDDAHNDDDANRGSDDARDADARGDDVSGDARSVLSAGGWSAAASRRTDQLLLVDPARRLHRLDVADQPERCAFFGASVAVTHRDLAAVSIVDPSDGEVRRAPIAGPATALTADARGWLVAVAEPQPGLQRIEADGRVGPVEPTAVAADRMVVVGDSVVMASGTTLHRLVASDHGWRERRAALELGRPALALTSAATRVYAAVTDYRPDGSAGPNHHYEPRIVAVDVAGWSVVETVGGLGVWSMFVDDRGIVAASPGAGLIAQSNGAWRTLATLLVPRSIAPRPDGWIAASEADSAFVFSDGHRIELEHPAEELARGVHAFFEATRAGSSCASCHPDGGSDRAMHDIGHGAPSPTLTVEGIAGTGPYLRGASYPTVASLDDVAQTVLGGYERVVPNRGALLEAYVTALPRRAPRTAPAPRRRAPGAAPPPSGRAPPETPPHRDPAPANLDAGVDAFFAASCDRCHRPGAFTNLAQYPAGLIFESARDPAQLLDTPSLLSVGSTAPYLFDGRATTLRAVLVEHNQGQRHGDTAHLSPDQLDALIAFLEAL